VPPLGLRISTQAAHGQGFPGRRDPQESARCKACTDLRTSIRVHVENHADIKASLLVGAEKEVAHIYDSAGVRFVWSTRPEHEDCATTLTIHLELMSVGMEGRLASGRSAGSKVLGQANREARRVYVFWSRVDAHLSHTMIEIGDGLGFVIAHELGHVLLARAETWARILA